MNGRKLPSSFFLKKTKLELLHRLFECLPAYGIVVRSNMENGAALIAISDTLVSNPIPISVLAHMYAARNSNGLSLSVTHRTNDLRYLIWEKYSIVLAQTQN